MYIFSTTAPQARKTSLLCCKLLLAGVHNSAVKLHAELQYSAQALRPEQLMLLQKQL